jgi:hypothetical protein
MNMTRKCDLAEWSGFKWNALLDWFALVPTIMKSFIRRSPCLRRECGKRYTRSEGGFDLAARALSHRKDLRGASS